MTAPNSFDYVLRHVDDCLPDYVLDHCNGEREILIGALIDGASTVADVLEQVLFQFTGEDHGRDTLDYARGEAAIRHAFASADPAAIWNAALDVPSDDNDDSYPEPNECHAWFRLSWSIGEEC